MRCVIVRLALALLLASAAPALAHHSFAPFNLEAEKTLIGTVKAFEWTNPHTWIWVDVPDGHVVGRGIGGGIRGILHESLL